MLFIAFDLLDNYKHSLAPMSSSAVRNTNSYGNSVAAGAAWCFLRCADAEFPEIEVAKRFDTL